MATISEKQKQLVDKLKELFMMDQADLNFGIYRVMNAKHDEIESFLHNDLLSTIHDVLQGDGKVSDVQKELNEAIKNAQSLGVDPDTIPKVQELKELLGNGGSNGIEKDENEIFSQLTTFFSRYYDGGDFMSLRRYKKETYSPLPMNGEEVKLHWANADQYYIKSAENFSHYAFKIGDKPNQQHVCFELVDASTEHNNVKATEDKERRFVLNESAPISLKQTEDGDECLINFSYQADVKKRSQKDLNQAAIKLISELELNDPLLENVANWSTWQAALLTLAPTDKNKKRTILEKHLNDYTAKNSFDYFIHKDLGGFMRRELDFFIKNELLLLDDIVPSSIDSLGSQLLSNERSLKKVIAFKSVAQKLIAFLAQLEDFQKKMWLKKKFVLETNYCMTLDRVPESFYAEIVANEKQIKEWLALGFLQPNTEITEQYLKENPYLLIDTALFDEEFKQRILAEIDDLDGTTDGLLIHSENFQALNLLQERYREQVKFVYIDPPYNTNSTPILYKNAYKHSSWASLMQDRLKVSMSMLNLSGVKAVAIDDTEMVNLSQLLEKEAPDYRMSRITVVHNPKGSITKDFNRTHEYTLFLTRENKKNVIARTLEENDSLRKMRRWGENSLRTDRRLSFYPIYVKDNKIIRVGDVPPDDFHPTSKNVITEEGEIEIWPIDQNGIERRWNFGLDSVRGNFSRIIIQNKDNEVDLFLSHELTVPKSVWVGGEYDAGNYGNTLLINILGEKLFDFPKSIKTVERCIHLATDDEEAPIILDYFGGSGTTAHATINLNREDKGKRKYVLVEMGDHFDNVLKPRTQKVAYAIQWKNGKPQQLEDYIKSLKKNISDKKGEMRNLSGLQSQNEFDYEKQRIQGEITQKEYLIDECNKGLKEGNAYGSISHCFKTLRLESYEDVMNNLKLQRNEQQEDALAKPDNKTLKEDYLLHYMLDVEAKESLLPVNLFVDPFNASMRVVRDNEARKQSIDLVETFNYLLGLRIKTMRQSKGIFEVTGINPNDQMVLILWRNTNETDNDTLDDWFKKQSYNSRDMEFDLIYVNGDNNLPNLRQGEETWKVQLIDEVFQTLMFDVKDV